MNIKVTKVMLKDGCQVGHGWLTTNAWAVRVGDDKRFISVATTEASFANLDVSPLDPDVRDFLNVNSRVPIMDEGLTRTQVLIEGEDGVLCRVFARYGSDLKRDTACLNEKFVNLMGNPPVMLTLAPPMMYSCAAGIIMATTDECPPWALKVQP